MAQTDYIDDTPQEDNQNLINTAQYLHTPPGPLQYIPVSLLHSPVYNISPPSNVLPLNSPSGLIGSPSNAYMSFVFPPPDSYQEDAGYTSMPNSVPMSPLMLSPNAYPLYELPPYDQYVQINQVSMPYYTVAVAGNENYRNNNVELPEKDGMSEALVLMPPPAKAPPAISSNTNQPVIGMPVIVCSSGGSNVKNCKTTEKVMQIKCEVNMSDITNSQDSHVVHNREDKIQSENEKSSQIHVLDTSRIEEDSMCMENLDSIFPNYESNAVMDHTYTYNIETLNSVNNTAQNRRYIHMRDMNHIQHVSHDGSYIPDASFEGENILFDMPHSELDQHKPAHCLQQERGFMFQGVWQKIPTPMKVPIYNCFVNSDLPMDVLGKPLLLNSTPRSGPIDLFVGQFWRHHMSLLFRHLPNNWTLHAAPDDMEFSSNWFEFKDLAKVRFYCKKCTDGWTSMYGMVIFFYRWAKSNTHGQVLFRMSGQKCGQCNPDTFEMPLWYPEEAQKVITNLYYDVSSNVYDLKVPQSIKSRRLGLPTSNHNKDLCQSCDHGMCRIAVQNEVEEQI